MKKMPVKTMLGALQDTDRHRWNTEDTDPDPFLLREVKPNEALPIYEYDGHPLPRGIRPDQLRHRFTGGVNSPTHTPLFQCSFVE